MTLPDRAVAGLGAVLRTVTGDRHVAVVGPEAGRLSAVLAAGGLEAVAGGGEGVDSRFDVLVALGVVDGATVEGSRSGVAALAVRATRAIVFSAGGDVDRFPTWWDELFAAEGFVPFDALRAELWEDPSWDAATLTSLVLYVRRSVAAEPDGAATASAIPRSAVHPGLYVRAHRAESAVQRVAALDRHPLSRDDDAAVVVRRMLEVRDQAAATARAELAAASGQATLERQRLERELRAASDRADVALAAADVAARDAAGVRTEAAGAAARAAGETAALRTRVGELVAALSADHGRSALGGFGRHAAEAVGRRVEWCALGGLAVAGRVPGPVGRVSRRVRDAYRSSAGPFIEATRAIFDEAFYVAQRPGVVGTGVDPLLHYLRIGWRQGLDPHPLFDTAWYLAAHPEAADRRHGPLEHFVAVGARNGCDPHPLFDVDWYLRRSPDVTVAGVNPLAHYLQHGWLEDRDPHPLFETARYKAHNSDLGRDVNPLVHYVRWGWMEGRSPGQLFDAEWYVEHHPEAATSGLPPYRYYLEIGLARGDHPSAWAAALFDDPAAA